MSQTPCLARHVTQGYFEGSIRELGVVIVDFESCRYEYFGKAREGSDL